MNNINTNEIGKRIFELRKKKDLSQEKLAIEIGASRTTITKWESGDSEPTASQLKKLAEIFGVSTDFLLGNADAAPKKYCIIDTCVVLNRPNVLELLIKKGLFTQIIIPSVVIEELNYNKDRSGKDSLKQRAWLALMCIENHKDSLIIETNDKNYSSINDDKIIDVAKKYAFESINNDVTILTNDIYFTLRNKALDINNLKVKQLKDIESKLYKSDLYDEYNTIKFISAVKSGKLSSVKEAFNDTVDVNRIDSITGRTPLIIAIRDRKYDIIEFLLSIDRLDLNKRDDDKYKFTPLLNCCQLRDLKSMELLIKNGASVNASSRGRNIGNTPLMVCAWGNWNDGIKMLMENDSLSYNQQDNNGFTALHKACIRNNYYGAKLLIDKIDHNIESFDNKKAVEYINDDYFDANKMRELFTK